MSAATKYFNAQMAVMKFFYELETVENVEEYATRKASMLREKLAILAQFEAFPVAQNEKQMKALETVANLIESAKKQFHNCNDTMEKISNTEIAIWDEVTSEKEILTGTNLIALPETTENK